MDGDHTKGFHRTPFTSTSPPLDTYRSRIRVRIYGPKETLTPSRFGRLEARKLGQIGIEQSRDQSGLSGEQILKVDTRFTYALLFGNVTPAIDCACMAIFFLT